MRDNDLLAIDEDARRRALEVESFIVEAPAGAGKTELLTQRYLRLLATVKAPEEIIAITFTNKAAAEMRARILLSLQSATLPVAEGLAPLPPHKQITRELALAALAHDVDLQWGLLDNPSRLRITTIDALSASLARQMPFLSRFGAQPAVSDDSATHYDSAVLRTLTLLEEDSDAGRTVAAALRYFHNDTARLQQLLVSMLERRDQWLGHLNSLEQHEGSAISVLIAIDLARAGTRVDAGLQAQLMPVARYAAGNLIALGSDSPIAKLGNWSEALHAGPTEGARDLLADLDLWRGLAALLLTNTGTLRKRFDKNMGLPAEKEAKPFKDALAAGIDTLAQTPGATEALARIQQLPEPVLDADEARIVAVFARLLKLAAAQLWTVFQQQREVDFIEIAQRALSALGEVDAPTNLQLRLDYRISHLLVDEFQDTSPAQIELLTKLTAGWQAGDGRTLFVVGDPMQSIYRFRKADVGLFLQAREVGIGAITLESLRLNRNNRSHPEVVEWINATFPEVFPAADNPQSGAVKFAASVATKPSALSAGVYTHAVLVAKDSESAGIDEAQRIIAILRDERAANPGGSIAILVRARPHLDALVTELQRSAPELRYQAVEIEKLESRQVIQDLLALTRALHHRADRVNWLATLRAPWCGLTLADLHALAAHDHQRTIWALINAQLGAESQSPLAGNRDAAGPLAALASASLSADGALRLRHVREVFAEALAQQGRMRTRRWVESVWRMLGGEACLRSAAERADADAYFRLLDQIEANGGFTLERLDKEVAALYAAPDPNAGDDANPAIQIMTVHKSKGLEFDAVILPGLHRPPRGGDSNLLLWEEFVDGHGHEHLVIAPVRPRKSKDDKKPTAYDYLRTLDSERESNEGSRVLYVAATRAIRALHLVAVATVEEKDAVDVVKPPKKGSPLESLWAQVEPDFTFALEDFRHSLPRCGGSPAIQESDDTTFAAFIPKLTRLAAPAIPAYLQADAAVAHASLAPRGRGAGGEETAFNIDSDAEVTDDNRLLLADIGTLAHRMLELIARDGLDRWHIERIESMQPALRRWLQGRGHAATSIGAAVSEVQAMLCTTLNSEPGRWVLTQRGEAGNELALTSRRDDQVMANVIDRTFVDNGERWIIDYKTMRLAPEIADHEMKAIAQNHAVQLQRYAELFNGENQPIRLAIFFVTAGKLVEL